MGCIIMCFHSSALTVGITKNGEINSSRTMARPGKASSINKASAAPTTTVMMITLPNSQMVLSTATENEGSVRKYSKFSKPIKPVCSGCIRL